MAMVETLLELEQAFRSKKEKMTAQEQNIIFSCKSDAVSDFTYGSLAAGTFVWTATWKLNKFLRLNLSAGAGVLFGLWRFIKSLHSCTDHIISLDGSRLQKELANIIVTKYPNDPWRMQLISKHFYLERVFDDSTADNPKLRWRYRNSYSDNIVHGHRTHDHNSYDNYHGDSHYDSYNNAHDESKNDTDSKRTNLETKHIFVNSGPDIMAEPDPLDYLFGYGAPVEEINHPNAPNKPPHKWGRRRSHRRRRMRNYEGLSNWENATTG